MASLLGRVHDVSDLQKRRKKRLRILSFLGLGILVIAVLLGVFIHLYLNHQYNAYEVEKTIKIKGSNTMNFEPCQGGILRYSRDGITAMNEQGDAIWNGSYDMENPSVDICDSSVVVADVGGKELYIYNQEQSGVNLSVDYTILQACISSQGVIAVLMEDATSNLIQIYDPFAEKNNRLLVEIPTNIDDGYPVALDMSFDGSSLVTSYVSVSTGTLQSRVSFYNFSDVGKNTNCLVGAQDFGSQVIGEIRYLDEASVGLFSENGFYVYKNLKKPKQSFKKKFQSEIHSVFASNGYIGVTLRTSNEQKDIMELYRTSGKRLLHRKIPSDYASIMMGGEEILLYAPNHCRVYRMNGVQKWDCGIDERIVSFLPGSGLKEYFLVGNDRVQKIKITDKK